MREVEVEEFITVWQTNEDSEQVVLQLYGVQTEFGDQLRASVCQYAHRLRSKGIPLKKYKRGQRGKRKKCRPRWAPIPNGPDTMYSLMELAISLEEGGGDA
jgi:hypothetical protein